MAEDWNIVQGDVLTTLPTLEAESVHCCVTSPPYWGLRDYGVEGQLGLEPTPDEYVAKMVAVFREVRRVLREDGTCWLNLGDSYANKGAKDSSSVGGFTGERIRAGAKGIMDSRPREIPAGLKTKDLVGIPWRVAFALQQPYYTGSIRRIEDRIWLAAMLDAEGCLFIHKRKTGQSNGQGYVRKNDNYGPGVEICNTSVAVVDRIMSLVGKGSISTSESGRHGRKQTLYRWNLRTTECREFVREVYPYLVAKQQQARILCGCPSSGERAEAAHAALIGLHNGVQTDVDFPAPQTMFEPGYYLRQDIIWSKSNPMPESVRDRCTKAHEYIFLLAKSERYYYDAEAVSEDAVGTGATTTGDLSYSNGAGRRDNIPSSRLRVDRERRNRRSVWTVTTKPYKGAHFATFPPKLIEPCILAGCPVGGTVLDPFTGSGTTGAVALEHGRKFVGVELNGEYIELAKARIGKVEPRLV
jgi:DNA modification methylase